MSNECDLRPYQIQLSFLNPPPPSPDQWQDVSLRTELSCSALHHPTSWDRNPFQGGATVLSGAPEMEQRWHMVSRYTGLLSALNGTAEPFSTEWASINPRHPLCEEKADFKGWREIPFGDSLCVLYHLLPWNLIFSMCKKKALTRSAVSACMLQLVNPVTRHKPAKRVFMMTCRLFPESDLASVNSAERSEDVRRIHICLTWAELVKRAELDEKPFFVLARSHFARMTVLHLTPFMDFKGSC